MSDSERHRPTRVISPLGFRVLVQIIPPDDRSSSGLYLPANVAESGTDALYGKVVEVARANSDKADSIEGDNVSGIPDGSLVLFSPEHGFRVPWNDNFRLIETKHVLAVVEEIHPDEAH
ncbi:MAG: co-chaperone GroES family protein [Myxococcota bacterium]|nr:co-chaperone GroES family protein [Myxococcota bacterium]